jgi:hypothetical protein
VEWKEVRDSRIERVGKMLGEQFQDVETDVGKGTFKVMCLKNPALVEVVEEDSAPLVPDPSASSKKSEDLVSCVVTVEFEEGGRGAAIRAECEDEVQGKLVQNCVAQMLGALGGIYV